MKTIYDLELHEHLQLDNPINSFSVNGIKEILHCHDACKLRVLKAFKKKDWKLSPKGRLKKCFEEKEKAI